MDRARVLSIVRVFRQIFCEFATNRVVFFPFPQGYTHIKCYFFRQIHTFPHYPQKNR